MGCGFSRPNAAPTRELQALPLNTKILKAGSRHDFNFGASKQIEYGSYSSIISVRRITDSKELVIKRMNKCYVGHEEKNYLHLLRHANIIRLEAFFVSDRRLFIVLERAINDVKSVMHHYPVEFLDMPNIMIVATSVLKALQFMHSHRILHCDVRLRHILLTDNGGVKLCGFGSTRSYPYLGGETGRLQYQAPELIRWNWTPEAYGPKVDIWAFGITMIELLDNVIPGMSLTRGQFLRAMHRQNYIGQQLRGYRRRWHQEVFGAVVRESLRFDPFHRYTAEEMLEDFYQLQED